MIEALHDVESFGSIIVRALRRFGPRAAFVEGERSVTYSQLADEIGRVRAVLAARGVVAGAGVAHLTQSCPEEFVVAAACYLDGLRYVPLHPKGSLEDWRFISEDAAVSVVVVQTSNFAAAAEELRRHLPLSVTIFSHESIGSLPALFDEARAVDPLPLTTAVRTGDIARIGYTGGTTGRPKGVVLSQGALATNAITLIAQLEWPRRLRFLSATPMSHATGILVVPVLAQGGTFVIQSTFSPERFVADVARHDITSTFLVPTMIYGVLDELTDHGAGLPTLEHIIYGASPISPSRLKDGLDRFGPVFQQLYGLTEVPNGVASLRISEHDADDEEALASCGFPLAGNRVELLDDSGAPVPTGSVGEVCVRSPWLMDRYWNQPEETAQVLAGGWFHTGDVGRFDEKGRLYLVDRKKDLIISGGFNVYAREVEDVLMAHPAVAGAAVIGVPDEKWGEAVKAIVVLRPGALVSADELKDAVRRVKGPVMAPKSVDFVDDLPQTSVGKLDKKALRSTYWRGQERQIN